MFDLGTATWALSAKQAYLGMGCRGPAQSYSWHSAQHRIMPPLISVLGTVVQQHPQLGLGWEQFQCQPVSVADSGLGQMPFGFGLCTVQPR